MRRLTISVTNNGSKRTTFSLDQRMLALLSFTLFVRGSAKSVLSSSSLAFCSLAVYPPHRGANLSSTFLVSVQLEDGSSGTGAREPPVFVSASDDRCKQFIPHQQEKWCPMGHTQAFTSFWFQGAPVSVTVTRFGGWGNWSQVHNSIYLT